MFNFICNKYNFINNVIVNSMKSSLNIRFIRRTIKTTPSTFCNEKSIPTSDDIPVNYITKKGEKIVVYGKEGDNLMQLAQRNSIDIEGACEASLACCTCHVYVDEEYYDQLPPISEEEEDLLDMAPFLKANSRLSI